MPFCSSCGSQVAEGVAFCPSCGAPMQRAAPPPQAPPAAPQYPAGGYGQPAYPPPGYAPPPYAPPPGQYPPGYGPYPAYGPMPGEKSAGVALVLSLLLTGLGQLYNGEISKGIIFLVVEIILWILSALTFGILCIVAVPFWLATGV